MAGGNFNLGEAVLGTSVDLDGLSRGLNDAEQQSQSAVGRMVTGFGDNMQIIGGMAIAGGIAIAGAVGAGAVESLKTFASFQQGMNEVFTLLPGISKEAMGKMTDDVKALAVEMGILPEEVIPALYQAISAGVPPDNLFEFLRTANKAAIGGVSTLETSVNGISSVVNAYGSNVLDATQASDVMFTAVRLGKTTFDELSQSLFNVIPTAASLHIQFGDVAAALATMTAQGVPTSVATTQLRQLFIELSKSGSETAKVFEGISGVSFAEFIAQGGNVQDALTLMDAAAHEAGVPISDLFSSVEAGNAALQLTGQGATTFAHNLDEMTRAQGATATAYETMDQGGARFWDRMMALGEVVKVTIGQALDPLATLFENMASQNLPILVSLLETQVIPAIESFTTFATLLFTNLDTGQPALLAMTDTLKATFGDSIILDNLTLLQPLIDTLFAAFVNSGVQVTDILTGLGIAILTVVIPALGALVIEFAPVLLTFAIVVGAVALLRQAWETNFLGIRDIAAKVFAWFNEQKPIIMAVLQTIGVIVKDVFEAIKKTVVDEVWPALKEAFDEITAALNESGLTWQDLGNAVVLVVKIIGAILLVAIALVLGFVEGTAKLLAAMGRAWQATIEDIKILIGGFKDYFQGLYDFIAGIFTLDFPRAMGGFIQMWKGSFEIVYGAVKLAADMIISVFDGLFSFIDGFTSGIADFFYNLYMDLVGGSIIPDMVNAVNKWFKAISLQTISDLINAVIRKFNELQATLSRLKLPKWMTPGSPTPLELGLRGINKELDKLNSDMLPDMMSNLQLGMAFDGTDGGAAPSAGGDEYHLHYTSNAPHDPNRDLKTLKSWAGT